MKLKVYIIRKKQIIWAAIILGILIIAAIIAISLRTKSTMGEIGNTGKTQTIRADINNDGKFDTIIAKTDDKTGKINVDVSCSDGNGYALEPDPSIKTLGYYNGSWPINVSINDIDGDKNAEIILQSSDGKGPVLHIFSYRGNKLERLTAGRHSTYGLLKNPKDSNQTLVLGSLSNDKLQLSYFNVKFGKLSTQVVPTALTLGKDTLNSLISYVDQKDVETFSSSVDNKMSSKISKGSYLDSKIFEAKYTNYNIPSEYTYILRTNTSENNVKEYAAYKVKVSLEKYDAKNPKYKITSIEKIKD